MVGEDKSLIFELEEVDFYLNQDFLEEAKAKLQDLQSRFPDNQGLKERLKVLAEKYAATEIKQLHDEVTDFKDLFEDEETPLPIYDSGGLASEMDAFLEDDAPVKPANINRTLEPIEKASPAVSNDNLFDEAQDFFNITSELEDEIFIPSPTTNVNLEAQLESIFDEFRDEVNESLSENDYETRYNLGIAYKEMDLLDEAIQEFQAAVKGKTHSVDAASMLGYCFIEKEMPPQAIQWFHKAISSYPQGVIDEKILGLKCALAEAYLLNDDKTQAAQITQEINQINPHFPGLRDLLQRIH
jgi:tetratricopeptide (TPR) repeat protein